jgi:hypothetical protein
MKKMKLAVPLIVFGFLYTGCASTPIMTGEVKKDTTLTGETAKLEVKGLSIPGRSTQ